MTLNSLCGGKKWGKKKKSWQFFFFQLHIRAMNSLQIWNMYNIWLVNSQLVSENIKQQELSVSARHFGADAGSLLSQPLDAIEFPTKVTRNCGASIYGSCKHGSSASTGMTVGAWACLNFSLSGFKQLCDYTKLFIFNNILRYKSNNLQ